MSKIFGRTSWAMAAAVDPERVQQWRMRVYRTEWIRCGARWDVAAIDPIDRGVAALERMRLNPRVGYPVLADHLSSRLYVMIPIGSGAPLTGVPGVRVLPESARVLAPAVGASLAAHWVSRPRPFTRLGVPAALLAQALQALDPPPGQAAR